MSVMEDRISYAYFRYGRFVSSHPYISLFWSICTFLFLSHPLFSLILAGRTFHEVTAVNSSLRHNHGHNDDAKDGGLSPSIIISADAASHVHHQVPNWMLQSSPAAFLIQVMACSTDVLHRHHHQHESRSSDDPKVTVIRWSQQIYDFLGRINMGSEGRTLADICRPATTLGYDISDIRCIYFSPALLQDEEMFRQEDLNLDSWQVYLMGLQPDNSRSLLRSLTSGDTTPLFAITLIFQDYPGRQFLQKLCSSLKSGYQVLTCPFSSSSGLGHIEVSFYYRIRKRLQRTLLPISYAMLVLYIYYTVSKIDMVSSKWGLAVSAVLTMVMSLVVAASICLQFNFLRSIWIVGYFPYIAMLVGLENSLCITRSVVSMPVRLDSVCRMSQGLSLEGWSLTKNFLVQLLIILVGNLTLVPEIQELCTFSLLVLFTDFFMQMFFYAPCLSIDLQRIDSEKREQLRRQQLTMRPVKLNEYPHAGCPIVRWFPTLVTLFQSLVASLYVRPVERYRSESNLHLITDSAAAPGIASRNGVSSHSANARSHRRTHSYTFNNNLGLENPGSFLLNSPPRKDSPAIEKIPRRYQILYFWTKRRLLTKCLMVCGCAWIVWLALFVHQLRELNDIAQNFEKAQADVTNKFANLRKDASSESGSERSAEHQEVEYRKMLGYWIAGLFDVIQYDLAGQYITLLPSVMIDLPKPDEEISEPSISLERSKGNGVTPQLWSQWLKYHARIFALVTSVIFLSVSSVIIYACIWSPKVASPNQGSAMCADVSKQERARGVFRQRRGSIDVFDSWPVKFRGHSWPVECMVLNKTGDAVISCSSLGRILVWDSKTGDCLRNLKPSNSFHRLDEPHLLQANSGGLPASLGLRFRDGHIPGGDDQQHIFSTHLSEVEESTSIWSMALDDVILSVGYDNGAIAFWNVVKGTQFGSLAPKNNSLASSGIGIIWMDMQNGWLVAITLPGLMDFVRVHADGRVTLERSITGHQHLITAFKVVDNLAFTGSVDCTVKVFDVCKCRYKNTFYGHDGTVIQITVSSTPEDNLICSSDSEGIICAWDRTTFELFYTIDALNAPVAVALSSCHLIGHDVKGDLYMWDRSTGALTSVISVPHCSSDLSSLLTGVRPSIPENLILLSENTLVLAWAGSLLLWDLNHKLLLRQVSLASPGENITHLRRVDSVSVMCCVDNILYRVDFPTRRSVK